MLAIDYRILRTIRHTISKIESAPYNVVQSSTVRWCWFSAVVSAIVVTNVLMRKNIVFLKYLES